MVRALWLAPLLSSGCVRLPELARIAHGDESAQSVPERVDMGAVTALLRSHLAYEKTPKPEGLEFSFQSGGRESTPRPRAWGRPFRARATLSGREPAAAAGALPTAPRRPG